MRLARRVPLFLAALALAVPAAAGDATVLLADGRTLLGSSIKGTADGQRLSIAHAGGTEELAIQDLLDVDFGKTPGKSTVPSVRLHNGDQMFGKVSFPSSRQVKISAGWGSVTAPIGWCAAIRIQDKAALPGPVRRDTIFLATDRVEGEIEGVVGGKVRINVGGTVVPVDIARVLGMAFAPQQRESEARGTAMLVDLGNDERLSGQFVKIDADALTMRLGWGSELAVPITSMARLEIKNGKVIYLTDLKPAETKVIPYLDDGRPIQTNKTVAGRPLRLRGKTYPRGLGMQSRSTVTYTLDGGFDRFRALCALDDAVGAQGSVVFRVFGDDKLLLETAVQRGGDAPVRLDLPMKGVLLLRLEVDYADQGDVGDQADWADARLLRP